MKKHTVILLKLDLLLLLSSFLSFVASFVFFSFFCCFFFCFFLLSFSQEKKMTEKKSRKKRTAFGKSMKRRRSLLTKKKTTRAHESVFFFTLRLQFLQKIFCFFCFIPTAFVHVDKEVLLTALIHGVLFTALLQLCSWSLLSMNPSIWRDEEDTKEAATSSSPWSNCSQLETSFQLLAAVKDFM